MHTAPPTAEDLGIMHRAAIRGFWAGRNDIAERMVECDRTSAFGRLRQATENLRHQPARVKHRAFTEELGT